MIRTLLITLLTLSVLPACQRAPRPNLVVISMDTTRADRLGAYGHAAARTPHIDALAKEGFVFRQHLTPVPITLPAHTSLFTGLYPPTHTVHDNGTFTVPDSAVTLAEVLHEAGYDTSAFVGAFPLAKQFHLDQGFTHYDGDFEEQRRERRAQRQAQVDIYFDERPAHEVVDAAIRYHRERDTGPFFTFLHFFDPHHPLIPPAPYDLEFRQQPYDGEIAYVDAQLGRFFAFLKERQDWDNTIIVVTADHGEGMGEHGELTHAILLHQATLHIPLILRGPTVPHGETTAWTNATQVFATLLELLGVPVPALTPAPSASVVPLLVNQGVPPPNWPEFTAYFETIAPRTTQGWSQLVGWMQGDWRLVHGPRSELYDLRADPQETQNRFGSSAPRQDTMLTTLRQFLQQHETRRVSESVSTLDAETRQRLAGLGYVQFDESTLKEFDDLLDVAERIDPKDRVIDITLYSTAKDAMARGNWNLALTLHQELIRRSPQHWLAYQSLAMLYGVIKDWEQCLRYLALAVKYQPDNADLQRFHGAILIEMGRWQEGIDVLRARKEPEQSVELCMWIGTGYERLGQGEMAREWYAKGLRLAPKDRWLRLYLANSLATEGRTEEAEGMYRALIADAPYFPLTFYNYGKLLLDRGEDQRAAGLLRRAAELAPSHAMTQTALRVLAEREKKMGAQ